MPSTYAALMASYATIGGLWRFRETSGTALACFTGAAGTANLAGTTYALNQTGALFETGDKSILFDHTAGVGDPHAVVTKNATTTLTTAGTICCWAKMTFDSGDKRLMGNRIGGAGYELLIVELGGPLYRLSGFLDGAGGAGATNLTTNTWYFFAMTWSGANIDLYINGVSERHDGTGAGASDPGAGADLWINGSPFSGGTGFAKAYIANPAILATELTAPQLLALYNAGATGMGLTPGGGLRGIRKAVRSGVRSIR